MPVATRTARHVQAPRARVYRALLEAESVRRWMVPNGMTSVVHAFDPREGGQFRITLTYADPTGTGKTTAHSDTYHGHFVSLERDRLVIETMEFESADPSMLGQMMVTFTLTDTSEGTEVVAVHDNLPQGLSASENETG